ncbi:mitochondrial transcription rescue factor 1 [Pleurodeles waltl]|uniref:mitochondrial transcription rescue factor 1 n=1 Tax=Pleurodeles waltl TaxID=8319 RepID=UPI003709BA39
MTGFRFPIILFRKFNIFVRPWERRSVCTHCVSRTPCMLPVHLHTKTAYYGTHTSGAFSVSPSRGLRLHLEKNLALSVRLKSDKASKKNRKQTLQEEEDDDDDDDDLDQRDFEDELEEDPNLPKDYKDLVKSVQSFRYDIVMKAGLDIARNKVEDAFYANQLRLNGEKLWKKSRAVKVGDTLDLILDQDKEAETVTVLRVVLKNVAEEKTGTDKYKVLLRRWKNLKLPKEDVLK